MVAQPRRASKFAVAALVLVASIPAGCTALAREDHPAPSLPSVVRGPSSAPSGTPEIGTSPGASSPPTGSLPDQPGASGQLGGPGRESEPVAKGYKRYDVAKAGISVDIPDEWLDYSGKDLQSLKELPGVGSALSGLGDDVLDFVAIDLSRQGTRAGTNLLVMDVAPVGGQIGLDVFGHGLLESLRQNPAAVGRLHLATVHYPLGVGRRVSGRMRTTSYIGYFHVYAWDAGGRTVVLFCFGAASQSGLDDALFTRMARSMRPLDGSVSNDTSGAITLPHALEGLA